MDQLLSIRQGKGGSEFGDVFEVEEEDITKVEYVGVRSDSEVCNRGRQGNMMTKNQYTAEGDGFGFPDIYLKTVVRHLCLYVLLENVNSYVR